MWTYLVAIIALVAYLLSPLWAQTVLNPAPVAIACAHNTVVPTPVNGQFYFVQCNSAGAILVGN